MRLNRRSFLQTAAGTASASLVDWSQFAKSLAADAKTDKLPVAAVVTEYRKNSHADVIIGKILEGFDQLGGPGPGLKLVSLYTDQVPDSDMSRALAAKHGFRIASTIEEAVLLGTGEVAVAGVISVGEHGKYPHTKDTDQCQYPRRRFFDEIVAAFRKGKRVVPVFNDKHLAWNWADGKHMYDTAKEMKIPFLAGSSLPVAWRNPPLTLARGCEIESAVMIGYGGLEAYGFHAVEGLQCMVERRKGAETGVARIETVQGDAIWEAEKAGRWSRELFDAALGTAPRYKEGRPEDVMSKDAAFYLIEYRDGFKATVAMANGLTDQFAFAARLKGEAKPVATCYTMQEGVPFGHFEHLLRAIDRMIQTGQPPYPVERTLLATGILDRAQLSRVAGKALDTPELDVRYEPADWGYAAGLPATPRAG